MQASAPIKVRLEVVKSKIEQIDYPSYSTYEPDPVTEITRVERISATTTMLRNAGRNSTASRLEELIRICEEDEDENYLVASLDSIVRFFLGIHKQKNTSDISLSPDGTFVAEWIGPDGKTQVAIEFLGEKVLLIRNADGRAKASRVDQLIAQSHLP